MRNYNSSDLFDMINRGNSFQNKVATTIRQIGTTTPVLNDKIGSTLENLKRLYKESIVIKFITAIKNNEMILICPAADPTARFDEFFPFIKAKLKGKNVVIVDVSRYTIIDRDDTGKALSYKVDVGKLYNIAVPAYISLKLYGPSVVLPSESTKYLANIWARMFCNVLQTNSIGILQNHSERYEAFMYFAMRFFMIYYLEAPMAIVDKVSETSLNAGKTEYINYIEQRCKEKEIDLYENFGAFCRNLFNNDITNIKGMSQKVNDMNQSEFLTIFRNQYGMNAIMSLCSVDYFTFAIFAGFNKANIVRDRGFDVILTGRKGEYRKDVPKLFDSLYKEL